MKSSSTAPKCSRSLRPRPAPETPLAASTTIPVVSISPARANGASGEGRRGRVAAGRGDERGAGEVGPEQLGQAVDELVEQRRGVVRFAVPGRVERGVVQPEVGGEVDDRAYPADEGRDELL